MHEHVHEQQQQHVHEQQRERRGVEGQEGQEGERPRAVSRHQKAFRATPIHRLAGSAHTKFPSISHHATQHMHTLELTPPHQ